MAEDLTEYLLENGVRARYLHSEVDTLRRIELLRELRMGEFDVLVGINLLREGLDLPEVSLVAILDADKEGFLRSGTALIQDDRPGPRGTCASARGGSHVRGQDHPVHGARDRRDQPPAAARSRSPTTSPAALTPQPLRKRIADILDTINREDADTQQLLGGAGRQQSRGKSPVPGLSSKNRASVAGGSGVGISTAPRGDLIAIIEQLTDQMHTAAAELQFEVAAPAPRRDQGASTHELRVCRPQGCNHVCALRAPSRLPAAGVIWGFTRPPAAGV